MDKKTDYDSLYCLYIYNVETEEEALINWAKPKEDDPANN